jgi:hypothetical protein
MLSASSLVNSFVLLNSEPSMSARKDRWGKGSQFSQDYSVLPGEESDGILGARLLSAVPPGGSRDQRVIL